MTTSQQVRELVDQLTPGMDAAECTTAKTRINTLLDQLERVESEAERQRRESDARQLVRDMFELDNAGD